MYRIKRKIKFYVKEIVSYYEIAMFFFNERKTIKNASLIFIFPYYHIGGAEKVHLQIVHLFRNHRVCVFFTESSKNNSLRNRFQNAARVYDISPYAAINKNTRKRFLFLLGRMLNRKRNLITIFGCNSPFFYDLLPLINEEIKKIDLIHAFSYPDQGIENYSARAITLLDHRVVINQKTLLDYKKQYKKLSIDDKFLTRIKIIENGIINPNKGETVLSKNSKSLNIGFIGRWSKEKRPELFVSIASDIQKIDKNIIFYMAGPSIDLHLEELVGAKVICMGEITNEADLHKLYKSLDILIITSYREGFPLTIMEAMFYGIVVIATDVGSIAEHIQNNVNGFLVENANDGNIVKERTKKIIMELNNDRDLLYSISRNSYRHALDNFDIIKFEEAYKGLLLS